MFIWLKFNEGEGEGKRMFREMRRKKQLLSQEETEAVLNRGSSGVLAVSGDEGYPYAVPLNYVLERDCIYFHSAKAGHKVDSIRKCEKVSFCVIDREEIVPAAYTTYFCSVIAFGRAYEITDEQEKRRAIQLLAHKYNPQDTQGHRDDMIEKDFSAVCIIKMEIDHLAGKKAIELVRHPDHS